MASSDIPSTGIGIKKPNTSEKISNEEFQKRILTIAKSKRDIIWWAENYFNIVTLDKGLQTIKLYEKQKELLKHIIYNNRSIILSARQTGKTTTYTIFCLWYATLFNDKKILICANKLQTAIEIMDRIRRAYEELPFWIKPAVLVYNKGEVTFNNMSSIRAYSTAASGARGASGNCIIIDEMAFIPKNIIDDFFASVMPIISSSKNSKSIIVSTPNGASGLYYDLWQEALHNKQIGAKDGWQPFRINWWDTGGIRDENWKKQQILTVGMEKWKQEYECDFLTSTTKRLIPDDILEQYKQKLSEYEVKGIKPKVQRIVSQAEDAFFEFKVWHEFQPNRTYLASADIAEGIGEDASVLYVWDVTDLSNMTLCLKFSSSKVSLVQFAYIISKILPLYNSPWLAAERNGVSAGMIDSLKVTYGYKNIISENKKKEPGIYSHVTVKSKACLWARDMMTTKGFGFTIYDEDLINELAYFVKKESKNMMNIYSAMPGPNSHDDHVLAFIWALFILNNDRVQDYFIVVDYLTTELNVVYAKILQPKNEYTSNEINAIYNDPLYKEYMEYKKLSNQMLQKSLENEAMEDKNDIFKYQSAHPQFDPYFDDFDDGQSWNSTSFDWNMKKPANHKLPAHIQLNPSKSNSMPSFFII